MGSNYKEWWNGIKWFSIIDLAYVNLISSIENMDCPQGNNLGIWDCGPNISGFGISGFSKVEEPHTYVIRKSEMLKWQLGILPFLKTCSVLVWMIRVSDFMRLIVLSWNNFHGPHRIVVISLCSKTKFWEWFLLEQNAR